MEAFYNIATGSNTMRYHLVKAEHLEFLLFTWIKKNSRPVENIFI